MTLKNRREDNREDRKNRRVARQQGRARILGIAAQVYEPGDDVESLKEKITEELEETETDRPWLAFLLELLEILAPILLRLLSGL